MYILKPKFDLIYVNLYNLYLLIHFLYVLYSASIRHAGISAIEKHYYYNITFVHVQSCRRLQTRNCNKHPVKKSQMSASA